MKKAAQVLNKLAAQFNEFWNSGCYIRAILTIVIPSVCIGLLLCLVITGVTAVFDFLRQHYTQLIFAALAIWAFLAWLDKHKANKVQIERETQNIRERQEYSDRLEVTEPDQPPQREAGTPKWLQEAKAAQRVQKREIIKSAEGHL